MSLLHELRALAKSLCNHLFLLTIYKDVQEIIRFEGVNYFMRKMALWILFLISFSLSAETSIESQRGPSGEWPLKFDLHGSAFMGASLVLSVNNAFFWSEDRLIDLIPWKVPQPYSGILRGLELVAVVLPINDLLFLVQHEFFGHGARAREFGFGTPLPVVATLPLPYGPGIGAQTHTGHDRETPLQSLIITIGGVEAANVLAEDISMRWWRHKKMNVKTAFMQILASHNTDGYLWIFSPKVFDAPGHDMVQYIDKVNKFYGDQRLSLDYMTWGVATNLLDPFLYFNFYSMYRYVVYGESDNSYPYFRFSDNVSYLPAARYVLSPFGPEYHLINYLSLFDRNIKAYGRYGKLADAQYYGIGATGDIWTLYNVTIGADLHAWRQPKLMNSSYGEMKFGGYGALLLDYRPFEVLSLNGHAGYKSAGYVLGEPIDQRFVWRVGLTLHM